MAVTRINFVSLSIETVQEPCQVDQPLGGPETIFKFIIA